MQLFYKVLLRSVVAVLIGGIIGSERARHGRAAGMRTHVLVCLGAALTSMTSLYVADFLGNNGDVFRIPAQVISGVGFLGAGMIILKSNNVITGLTTAAGVWTTGAIGVAIGYGFYQGAIIVSLLFLITIVLFAKVERRKKNTEVLYIEIEDVYRTNEIITSLEEIISAPFSYQTVAPKSNLTGHLGFNIVIEETLKIDVDELLKIENVVLAVGD